MGENEIFDARTMAELTQHIIQEAYATGNCVIVGRGAQCILQKKHDVFHVFIYAPLRERVERLKTRLEHGADVGERIRTVDGERARYLHQRFGRNWCDQHLYDLLISSKGDENATARIIHYAMTGKLPA
jgi:cytidylate kinase